MNQPPSEPVPTPQPSGNFNLGDMIARDTQNVADFELPKAVEAANRVIEGMRVDPKTGLENEVTWKQNLNDRLAELKPGEKLRVYAGDVDGFKAINDARGHEAGDQVLGIVGEALRLTFRRSSDEITYIARFGGDEFAVAELLQADENQVAHRLPETQATPEQQAERANTVLQTLVQGTEFEQFSPRLSFGYAISEPGDTAEALYARADMNMLENKYKGKTDQPISDEDRQKLRELLPILDRIGHRVEPWARTAAA